MAFINQIADYNAGVCNVGEVCVVNEPALGNPREPGVGPGLSRLALGLGPSPAQPLLKLGDALADEVPDLPRGHRRAAAKADHLLEADQGAPIYGRVAQPDPGRLAGRSLPNLLYVAHGRVLVQAVRREFREIQALQTPGKALAGDEHIVEPCAGWLGCRDKIAAPGLVGFLHGRLLFPRFIRFVFNLAAGLATDGHPASSLGDDAWLTADLARPHGLADRLVERGIRRLVEAWVWRRILIAEVHSQAAVLLFDLPHVEIRIC